MASDLNGLLCNPPISLPVSSHEPTCRPEVTPCFAADACSSRKGHETDTTPGTSMHTTSASMKCGRKCVLFMATTCGSPIRLHNLRGAREAGNGTGERPACPASRPGGTDTTAAKENGAGARTSLALPGGGFRPPSRRRRPLSASPSAEGQTGGRRPAAGGVGKKLFRGRSFSPFS